MTTPPGVPRLAVFTICSNNYMPFARVLLESVGRHHPEADLFVCLADRRIEFDGLYSSAWTVVEAEALPIPGFPAFAFRYDIMEFNTALKPFMFQHLVDELGYDQALYFDPDIELFAPLEAVTGALGAGASFALTPHLCSPCEDRLEPNDLTIMRAGAYNLGFLGASRSEETSELLAWWARRLRYECINAQQDGIFVDQKFMDLLPSFARRAVVLHDTSLNVAYWNLPQRSLQNDGNGWTVDGAPLTFFHFSGFDPRKPSRLSKHDPRFATDMPEPLARLTAHYAGQLMRCGFDAIPASSYAYGRFASGTVIHHTVRRMFRETHRFWAGDPFETYEAFLHEPWPDASRAVLNQTVTNHMKFIHGLFPQLSSRLDLGQPGHVSELTHWFVNDAATSLHLDLPLVEAEAARMGERRNPLERVPARTGATAAVSVVGYLRTASGVGEAGRQTLRTLQAAGLDVEGVDVALGVAGPRDDASCEALLAEAAGAPVQVFNINADQLPAVMAHMAPHLRADALRIGIPFWELSRYPAEWLEAFGRVHEVWAPTRFIQTALAGRTDRPVIHMPVALELGPVAAVPRSRFGVPENRFVFFFAFDFLSFVERKNPRAAIGAFCRAFPRRGEACLVLKTLNGDLAPDARAALAAEIDGHPDILLLDGALSREDTLGLLANSDAVVSLHRSEGMGLLIAEAMLLGKPVIATGYSASRELVTNRTGYPVGFQVVPVKEGEYPFHVDQLWAEADVAHAAWLMTRLQANPQRAAPVVAAAREHVRRQHGRREVAARQLARLRQLGLDAA